MSALNSSNPADIHPCPAQSVCIGYDNVPIPNAGFYVFSPQNKPAFGTVYQCLRSTCKGAATGGGDLGCWKFGSRCGAEEYARLQCTVGAQAALCGSCAAGFAFSSSTLRCASCASSAKASLAVALLALALALAGSAGVASGRVRPPAWLTQQSWAKLFDRGAFQVCFSTYQIVQSTPWALSISFPTLFQKFTALLSFFSFSFLSPECALGSGAALKAVLLWAVAPIVLTVLNALVLLSRAFCLAGEAGSLAALASIRRALLGRARGGGGGESGADDASYDAASALVRQHASAALVVPYALLPLVSRKQLEALVCLPVGGATLLAVDTSVRCDGRIFARFRAANTCLLAANAAFLVSWALLLFRARAKLNPPTTDRAYANFLVAREPSLRPFRFLFSLYNPSAYFLEPLEM